MNKILFVAVIAAFLVAGCSDKDDAASGTTEPSMLEKAKESTKGAMSDIKGATSEAMDKRGQDGGGCARRRSLRCQRCQDGGYSSCRQGMGNASDMASDATEAVAHVCQMAVLLGQQVYQNSCQSCHAVGVAGAPKLGDKAAWAPRIATGMDALLASSINGKNIMPPRGACASCSDDDLKAAVQYMVSQSK